MKKCPVCAVEVEDNAPFCNICGVNLAGAKDVGPSQVETPVSGDSKSASSTKSVPLVTSSRSSFYLPALQFLLAVALLGLILYYTTDEVPRPDYVFAEGTPQEEGLANYTGYNEPFQCPSWGSVEGNGDGCPLILDSPSDITDISAFSIESHKYQTVLGLTILLGLCILIQGRRISDSNIMAPLIFLIILMALVYLYMGRNETPLAALETTLGATAGLAVIIVSYIVFLYAVTGKDISEAPISTIYSFIGAGSLVFAALHHNWVRGPWKSCSAFIKDPDAGVEQACLQVSGDVEIVYVDLQSIEMLILLVGLLFLLLGVAGYILQTVRLKDMEEAKYFFMILTGLALQFAVLVWNLVRNRGNVYFEQSDIVLTVLSFSITVIGIVLFYRKRKSEQSMEGFAYFGLFVAGIGTLFATMIAPALLGHRDISSPTNATEWIMYGLPIAVAGGAVWYGLKYGTEKFKDRMMEMQLSSPPKDPFDSSFEPEVESADEEAAPTPSEESSGDITLEDAMDRLLSEFPEATIDIKPTEDENYGVDLSHLDDLEKDLKEDLAQSPKIRKAMKVDYKVDYKELSKYYSTTEDTINQTVTHLKSGRNIMLYGDPGTGKTALANLLLSQICGVKEGKDGSPIPNYTIVTANAEWSNFEVIGGISPDDSGGYFFKDGYVADAAKSCEKTMQEDGKPHYLVIDEFNRANIDEAFGKLFTVFEYRDKQALLTAKETGGAPFMMPPEFRIIGTMNTQDKNTLFNVGHALMRRFAFVEIGLPDRDDEYKRMPIFVYNKLNKLGIAPERPDEEEDWYAKEMFDFYDDDGTMFKAFNKFMNFLEEEELPQSRDDEIARGIRTYRKIGPAVIIDSMLTVFNSKGQYELDRALEDVIKSNIMPALEGLERNELKCLMLKAQEVLGPNHGITSTLEKMVDSPGLSVFG
ncbi:MAG: AAA family ATPase [SAR86 cluster bacterium]|nr:AAA family ATPase [SAR86 cluster bacterium]